MRAIVWSDYGPPSRVLSLGDVARPVPGDDEVLVRVAAASVHAGDWLEVTGTPYVVRLAAGFPRPRRTSPGRDMAGQVEAVGANVQHLAPGDEVFGECVGALAEYVCGREGRLAPKPAALSFEQAAAVPVSGVTALRALRDVADVQAGATVLVNGASGGVGTFAVQIAKAVGARVTGVCSTSNLELVRSIGADVVIDYTREDFTKGEERYDVILDNAGTRSLSECRRVLAAGGTLIPNNGTTGGRWIGTIGRTVGALMMSPFVGQRLRPFFSTTTRDHLESLTALIEDGSVTPVVAATYDLSRAADALEHVGTGHAAGKVVITV